MRCWFIYFISSFLPAVVLGLQRHDLPTALVRFGGMWWGTGTFFRCYRINRGLLSITEKRKVLQKNEFPISQLNESIRLPAMMLCISNEINVQWSFNRELNKQIANEFPMFNIIRNTEKSLHTKLFEIIPKQPTLSCAVTAIYIFHRELDAKWNASWTQIPLRHAIFVTRRTSRLAAYDV